MKKVKLRNRAAADIEENAAWYDAQEPGIGDEFRSEVRQALNIIARNPLAFPEKDRAVRRYLMKQFPFSIYYLVDDEAVTILRVFHASREPAAWKRN